MGRKENLVKTACLKYLALRGIPAWANNSGMAWLKTGKGFMPVWFGTPGSPDILGVLPGSGRLLCVEAKRPARRGDSGGRQSAEQRQFEACMAAAGALYVVARTAADLAEAVEAASPARCQVPLPKRPPRPPRGRGGARGAGGALRVAPKCPPGARPRSVAVNAPQGGLF